jgi:ligand-binding sensor domain-containing protein
MNRKLLIALLIGPLFFQYCTTEEPVDMEKSRWKYYTKTTGLSDNFISAIYEDKDGNMWFAYDGYGVSRYDGKSFTKYNTATQSLGSNFVNCFFQQKNGDFLVGTSNGLNVFRGNTWLHYPALIGVPVRSLYEDAQGTLWIGTQSYGIIYYKNATFTQLLDNTCGNCNTVPSIYGHSDGKIWFATGGGVKVYNGSFMTLYTTLQGLPADNAYALQEDAHKNVWIGTNGAGTVGRYHNNVFDKVSLSNGTTDEWVTAIAKGDPGELWFGTLQGGLIHYDGAVMRKIFKGPPDDTITCLFKDKKGNLWIGTYDGGVARYNPHGL